MATGRQAIGGHPQGFGATRRTDKWWIEPLWQAGGFLCFVIYANWAAFQGQHYWHEAYLSPFYSPVLFTNIAEAGVEGAAPVAHAWLGAWPAWLQNVWPAWLPTSPAWLILAGPLSFRATCYYYRKFYYRAYFMSPPGCAVGPAPQKKYKGETFLFLFQNLHRYTWYIAVTYIVILGWDAFVGFWQDGEVFSGQLGIGVGTVMLCLNAVFLGLYVFGCHSCRHIVAGKLNCFSCTKITRTRYSLWQRVTRLNEHHMFWGWVSMIWVGLTDAYIRLCANGIITDYNTW
jgi:hypothetical protein